LTRVHCLLTLGVFVVANANLGPRVDLQAIVPRWSVRQQPRDPVPAERPNFSGKWTLVSDTASGPLGAGGTILQDAVLITFSQSGGPHGITYRLDGRESIRQSTSGWTVASQTRWVKDALSIITRFTAPAGASYEDLVTCTLGRDGRLTMVSVQASPQRSQSMSIYTKS
jgi:hypothetical protein